VKVQGSDVTILTVGATLYRVMDAVKLFAEHGISAEVIDARSLVPFNYEKVIESVKKTGKIIVTGDACERGSHMAEFARNITELAFDYLDAPPVVVGAKNWITPAHEMEDYFFPQAYWLVDAYHEKIAPIPGYTAKHNFTELEQISNNKKGV
jgi:2-oxoisovalerate dehydrogenase E1 component